MNRPRAITAAIAALAPLTAAAPANADRAADGPVRAPRLVQSLHSEFTLPGGPWSQIVGALAGTPVYGSYQVSVPLATGEPCLISVSVRADAKKRYPSVGRRTVRLTPGPLGDPPLRFDHHGRHDGVRWWSGRIVGSSVEASGGAVQRMPDALRSASHRWLVYRIDADGRAVPNDEAECTARAHRTGARVVRSIARTLKLADGPPVSEAPFTPA
jgi:hypothetical protein